MWDTGEITEEESGGTVMQKELREALSNTCINESAITLQRAPKEFVKIPGLKSEK